MWLAFSARWRSSEAEQGVCFRCAEAQRTFRRIHLLVLRFLRLTTTEGIVLVRLNIKNDSPSFQTTFYITESSAYRNKILYFRQDDWATLCRPLIDRLASGTFERIPDVNLNLLCSWNLHTYFGLQSEAIELLRQRKLGFSLVRLLPKDTGVRPIVNLRRRPTPKVCVSNTRVALGWTSVGLLCCWKVHQPDSSGRLWYPKLREGTYPDFNSPQNRLVKQVNQSPLLGTSVFGPDDVYLKLKTFKAALPRDNNGDMYVPRPIYGQQLIVHM